MYFPRLTRLTKACAAAGLVLGVGLLVAPKPARAGDDDSSFYKQTFGRLLEGFGLKSADDDNDIHYRERPPLVIPPNSNLPPPEKASAVPNPAWPKDPDVTRRERLEKLRKNRDVEAERRREENPLPPDQLGPSGRVGPRQASTDDGYTRPTGDFGNPLSPSQLGFKGGLLGKMFHSDNDEVAKFTGEPPRTSLTEPPPGYQTPSPDQPYGTGQARAPKADNDYLHRGELQR
jgi:hypothetical protein